MKKVVQCTGVIITICGWLLINAEHFSGMYPVVAPKYLRAMEAYHHIDENLEVMLKEGDVGFDEIAQESRRGDSDEIIRQMSVFWHHARLC